MKISYLFILNLSVSALLATLLPVSFDEAYYFKWSSMPAFGYFDHPPFVALLASGYRFLAESVFFGRLGALLTGVCSFWGFYFLLKNIGMRDAQSQVAALVIGQFNLVTILFGVLTTPDAMLHMAWIFALLELAKALNGRPQRWLWVGAWIGLGLLSKYTMVLMALICLWSTLSLDKKILKSKWPYLGVAVCFLVFLPNIIWNAQNGWVTMKYQFKHGMSAERNYLGKAEILSNLPEKLNILSKESLQFNFEKIKQASKNLTKDDHIPKKPASEVQKRLARVGEFLGGQLGFLGFFLPVMFFMMIFGKNHRSYLWDSFKSAHPIVKASTFVPLLFFGVLSPFTKIEANWAALYIFGFAIFITPVFKKNKSSLVLGLGLNLLVLIGVAIHATYPWIPISVKSDRLLQESHGFELLAEKIEKDGVSTLYVENYQLASMMSYHKPNFGVIQLPGISRPSEYTRNPRLGYSGKLGQPEKMAFLTTNKRLPQFKNYKLQKLSLVKDCYQERLQIFTIEAGINAKSEAKPCPVSVHDWYLGEYVKNFN